jgi:hypothetical protein
LIIESESPLRRLPSQLNPRQILFLDGIRYSIEMADLAFMRLKQTLFQLSSVYDKKDLNHLAFVSAIQDGWSIIDYVHRLRRLLKQCPGIKQKSPGMILFFKATEAVESLRNIVQHLETEIYNFINNNFAIWGEIIWIYVPNPSINLVHSCSIIAGTLFRNMNFQMINLAGKSLLPPIDLITLIAAGNNICLSDVMEKIETLTKKIEDTMREQFKELPQAGADLFFCAEMVSEE